VLSLMIRMSLSNMVLDTIFDLLCNFIKCRNMATTAERESSMLCLYSMLYQAGRSVVMPTHILSVATDTFVTHVLSLSKQPRSLRALACIAARRNLKGPNIVSSLQRAHYIPPRIKDILTLQTLDITRTLEPELFKDEHR